MNTGDILCLQLHCANQQLPQISVCVPIITLSNFVSSYVWYSVLVIVQLALHCLSFVLQTPAYRLAAQLADIGRVNLSIRNFHTEKACLPEVAKTLQFLYCLQSHQKWQLNLSRAPWDTGAETSTDREGLVRREALCLLLFVPSSPWSPAPHTLTIYLTFRFKGQVNCVRCQPIQLDQFLLLTRSYMGINLTPTVL